MSDATANRWDLYGPIHKGLRRAHALMLLRIGNADFTGDTSGLLADLRRHLAISADHLHHEEQYIHPPLKARVPHATDRLEDQHQHHREHFLALFEQIEAIEAGDSSAAAGRRLYRLFTRFVADDLGHMAEEEEITFPILCHHFTDAELQAIERAIVEDMDPDLAGPVTEAMLAATNIDERVTLLSGMRQGMPAEIYTYLFHAAVRPTASPADLQRLAHLGLAA